MVKINDPSDRSSLTPHVETSPSGGQSSLDTPHLEKGDMLREIYSDGFRVLGRVVEKTGDGALVVMDGIPKAFSYSELMEKAGTGKWDFVRPMVEQGITRYYPVKTYAEEDPTPSLPEPQEETPHFELRQKLENLKQEREQTRQSYHEWLEAKKKEQRWTKYPEGLWVLGKTKVKDVLRGIELWLNLPSIGGLDPRLGRGFIEFAPKAKKDEFTFEIHGFSEIPDYPADAPWGEGVEDWRQIIETLDKKIGEMEGDIRNVHPNQSRVLPAPRSPVVLASREISEARNNLERLQAKLRAVERFEAAGDGEEALVMAMGGTWDYRMLFDAALGSVEARLQEGKAVLTVTGKINRLIREGEIKFDREILSSLDLLEVWNMPLQSYLARRGNLPLIPEGRPHFSKEGVMEEYGRLRALEAKHAEEFALAEKIGGHLPKPDSKLEQDWRKVVAFGKGVLDLINDPTTAVMVAAGHVAGLAGRAVQVRALTAGFGKVPSSLIALSIEGVVFHNAQNAGTLAFYPDLPFDLSVGGNIHSIVMLGWLRTVGRGFGKISEATLLSFRKDFPALFRIAHTSGSFSSKVFGFASLGAAEKSILENIPITFDTLAEELYHATQMVLAFNTLEAAKQPHGRRSIVEEALLRANRRVIEFHEKNDKKRLGRALITQARLQLERLKEEKEKIHLSRVAREIGDEGYAKIVERLEAQEKFAAELLQKLKGLQKQKGEAAAEMTMEEALSSAADLRRSGLLQIIAAPSVEHLTPEQLDELSKLLVEVYQKSSAVLKRHNKEWSLRSLIKLIDLTMQVSIKRKVMPAALALRLLVPNQFADEGIRAELRAVVESLTTAGQSDAMEFMLRAEVRSLIDDPKNPVTDEKEIYERFAQETGLPMKVDPHRADAVKERFDILCRIVPEEMARNMEEVRGSNIAHLEKLLQEMSKLFGGTIVIASEAKQSPDGDREIATAPAGPRNDTRLTLVEPTIAAMEAAIAGILANIPVYFEGETSVGKNLIVKYLAEKAGAPLYRINFSKETDSTHLYGHYEVQIDPATGKKRVVIVDGKMVEALQKGFWVLWDEVNLAEPGFLVAQNDLLQQIASGTVSIKQGGEVKQVKVHKNFRLFAAANPEGYTNRKPLEETFADRWFPVMVRDYSPKDLEIILKESFPELDGATVALLPRILAETRLVLGEQEGKKITLRTLKRIAARLQEIHPLPPPSPLMGEGWGEGAKLAEAIDAEIFDSLHATQYKNVIEMLKKLLPVKGEDFEAALKKRVSEEELDAAVEEYKRIVNAPSPPPSSTRGEGDKSIPSPLMGEGGGEGGLVPVSTTVHYAFKVLNSLKRGDYLILEGLPATSKSAIPKWLGFRLQQRVVEVNGTKEISSADLVGMPTLDKEGNLVFQKGSFLEAMESGAILVVNEANLIPADIWERLNSVFDEDRAIFITENGVKRPVKMHKNFRLILTLNPKEAFGGGRGNFSVAMENKFRKIVFRESFKPEELRRIISERTPALQGSAAPMVDLYEGAGRLLAGAGILLTLRDLNRWQDIWTALVREKILSPEEALFFGAELVFKGRLATLDSKEQLVPLFAEFAGAITKNERDKSAVQEDPATERLRKKIRGMVHGEQVGSILEIYKKLAAEAGVALDVWVGTACREATPEGVAEIFKHFGLNVNEQITLIRRYKLESGKPLLRFFLKNEDDFFIRRAAIEALGWLVGKEEIPDLLRLLTDGDSSIRWRAIEALGRLGEKEGIEHLRRLLKNGDRDVRWRAAEALGRLGEKEGIEHLRRLLKDEDDFFIRSNVIEALGRLGGKEAVPDLRLLLKNRDLSIRRYAAEALGRLGEKEGIESLRLLLKDGNRNVRMKAAEALGRLGEKEAVPDLRLRLKDKSSDVRMYAAEALGRLGVKEAVPDLLRLLKDGDRNVRWYAAEALGRLGEKGGIEYLLRRLKYGDRDVRWRTAEALDELSPGWSRPFAEDFARIQRGVAEVLAEKPSEVQKAAEGDVEKFLKAITPADERAMEMQIRRLIQEGASTEMEIFKKIFVGPAVTKNESRERDVLVLLGRLLPYLPPEKTTQILKKYFGPSISSIEWIRDFNIRSAWPLLVEWLDVQDGSSKKMHSGSIAALALGTLRATEAIPALKEKLHRYLHPESMVHIAYALAQMGDAEGREFLVESTARMGGMGVTDFAIRAMGELGINEPRAIANLMARFDPLEKNYQYRLDAIKSLAKLGIKEAIPEIRKRLDDPEKSVQREAAKALGRLQDTASIPKLRAMLNDKNILMQSDVAEVLAQMGVPEGIDKLRAILRMPEDYHQRIAIESIVALGREKAAPLIPDLLVLKDTACKDFLLRDLVDVFGALDIREATSWLLSILDVEKAGMFAPARAATVLKDWGVAEAIPALKKLMTQITSEDWRLVDALNKLEPGWDDALLKKGILYQRAYTEVLAEKPSEVQKAAEGDVEKFLKAISGTLGRDSEGNSVAKEKMTELASLVPADVRVTMVAPMMEVIKAVSSAILSNMPIYVEGETGVGKNQLFRKIAEAAKMPLYRLNFSPETDNSQLYGHYEVKVDPKTKKKVIVITDGKMIDWLRFGGYMFWDEVNLASPAFLAAQNDLLQEFAKGKVFIKMGGEIRTVKVHTTCRLFAAGNPEGTAGRQATEKTFQSRFLKIVMRELNTEEMQQILREEYPVLHEETDHHLPMILQALKLEAKGPRITPRTLKEIAVLIAEAAGEKLWDGEILSEKGMEVFTAALDAEVLDALGGEQYKKAVEILEKALPRGGKPLVDYLNRPVSKEEFFRLVEEYKKRVAPSPQPSPTRGEGDKSIPSPLMGEGWGEGGLVPVPTTLQYAFKVLNAFLRGRFVLLEGGPATSKSAIPKWIGKLTGQEVIEVTGSKEMSVSDLIGMPTLDEGGNFILRPGFFLEALKKGAILVVNEGNLIPTAVWERLNSVFDDDRALYLIENGEKKPIQVGNFRLVITQNPKGTYRGGRGEFSAPLENRLRKIMVRDKFTPEELKEIIAVQSPWLREVAAPMVDLYEGAGRLLAEGGMDVTLRDLNRWEGISGDLARHGILRPADALLYGAELVFKGRLATADARERLDPLFAEFAGAITKNERDKSAVQEDPATERLRKKIRGMVHGEQVGSIQEIYEKLAAEAGVALDVWVGTACREATPEGVAEIFKHFGLNVREQIDLIGHYKLESGKPLLRSFLKNEDDFFVRRDAIEALGRLGGKEAIPDLRLRLKDGDSDIRWRAAEVLGLLGGKEAVPDLRLRLKDVDESVRMKAVEALGRLVGKEAIPDLHRLLKDVDNSVRWQAAEMLGRLGEKKGIEYLRRLLKDEDIFIRWRAAEALGQLGEKEGIEYLRLLLKDVHPDVRRKAAEALGRLGEKEGIEHLRLRLKDGDRDVRWRAAEALGRLGGKEAVPDLLLRLKDKSSDVRMKAAEALGRLGEKEGIEYLRLLLKDVYPDVRGFAAEALGRLGGKEAVPDLLLLLKDKSLDVRWRAIEALDELSPGWSRPFAEDFARIQKGVAEVLAEKPEEIAEATAKEVEEFVARIRGAAVKPAALLSAEIGRDSDGKPVSREKMEELLDLVPKNVRVTMVAPMAEAQKAAATAIMSNIPFYVEGETGVGKNKLFAKLAEEANMPLYRIIFGPEIDNSQLYGHFEMQTDPATGKKRVVIADGRIVEWLKYGGYMFWDEVNLASPGFLAAQNDFLQQLASGRVSIQQGGVTKIIPVHKTCRLFAAGNPEGMGGRQHPERTFANRFLKFVMREPGVEDMRQILRGEYPLLSASAETTHHLPKILKVLQLQLSARGIKITPRTLKRIAARLQEIHPSPQPSPTRGEGDKSIPSSTRGEGDKSIPSSTRGEGDKSIPSPLMGEGQGEGEKLWDSPDLLSQKGMQVFVAAIEAEVLDGLSGSQYKSTVEALEKALPRGGKGITKYLNRPVPRNVLDARVAAYRRSFLANGGKPVKTCPFWEYLVPVPTTLQYAGKVIDALQKGDFLILEGPKAVSKSAIPKWLGALTGQEVIEVTGSKDTSVADLIGMPTLNAEGVFVLGKGFFRDALEKDAILVVNEGNLIHTAVWERLNSVFDDDRTLYVIENGIRRPIRVKNFRLVITKNPETQRGGRSPFSAALENRLRTIVFRDDFKTEELHQIARVRMGLPYEKIASVIARVAEGGKAFRGAPVTGMPAGGASLVGSAMQMMRTVFHPKRGRAAEEAGREGDQPGFFEKKRLEAKAMEAEAKIKEEIDAFMRQHGETVRNMGNLGAGQYVRVQIDTEVDIAAMDMEKRILYINPLAAKELTAAQIAAVALHEGGHAAITRMGDRFFFEKKSLHLLNNCLEDPRVNEYELARLPGAREDFAALYEDFFPDPKKMARAEAGGEIEPPGDLPHEQLAYGFIDAWANGRLTERVTRPEVRAALEELLPVARQIWATHPGLFAPREREIRAKQKEVHDLIREKILPIYEKFYKESLEEIKKRLREGKGGGGDDEGDGKGNGKVRTGGGDSIDPEDLDAWSRKILEERAGKMADALDPRPVPPHWKDKVNKAREKGAREEAAKKPARAGEGAFTEESFRPYDRRTFADVLEENARRKQSREEFYAENPYRKYLDPVQAMALEVGEALRQILKLDTDYEFEGNFISGQKLNVRKAVEVILRNEAGIFTEDDFKLFLRKRFPTKRSHKFVLVLDESGSMKGDAQTPAMQAMMLFQSVMNQLGVDYGVVGFADYAQIHKEFGEEVKTEAQKNELVGYLETSGGGGTNDLEGIRVAKDMLDPIDADEKTIIVITDGAGVDTTKGYVRELEAAGVHVIGIGIGPGTEKVAEVYTDAYQDHDFAGLPQILLRILTRRFLGTENSQ